MSTRGVPESDMHFSGEPTSDGDTAGEYLRVWYEANRPDLQADAVRPAWAHWVRKTFFGYERYDPIARRDSFMRALIEEVKRIETERLRQVFIALGASEVEAPDFNPGSSGSNPDEGATQQEARMQPFT